MKTEWRRWVQAAAVVISACILTSPAWGCSQTPAVVLAMTCDLAEEESADSSSPLAKEEAEEDSGSTDGDTPAQETGLTEDFLERSPEPEAEREQPESLPEREQPESLPEPEQPESLPEPEQPESLPEREQPESLPEPEEAELQLNQLEFLTATSSQLKEKADGCGAAPPDLAAAQPLSLDAGSLQWTVRCATRLEENGISVEAGSQRSQLIHQLPEELLYISWGPEKNEEQLTIPVIWNNLPDDESLSFPGKYVATVSPVQDSWHGVRLPPLSVPIYVVESGKPHIQEIFRMEDTVAFRYLSEIRQPDTVALLCSSDGGLSWQDACALPGCSAIVSPYNAVLDGLEKNHVYLFKLAVTGGPMEGESEEILFSYYEDDPDRYGQGDADGSDRTDQGEALPGNEPPGPAAIGRGGGGESGGIGAQGQGRAGRDADKGPGVSIRLSGQEIKDQIEANPQQVTLLAGGEKVIIPTPSLSELQVEQTDAFAAVLEETPKGEVSVRFWLNDKEIYLSGALTAVAQTAPAGGGKGRPVESGGAQKAVTAALVCALTLAFIAIRAGWGGRGGDDR